VVGAAARAVVGGGGGAGATALDGAGATDLDLVGATVTGAAGAAVTGAAVTRGFGFAFVAARVAVGEAVKVGEATVEVLLAGVVFPQPVTIPVTSTMKPMTAMPNLCSFFIDGPPDGPPLSA
jgi:hypothetical protein